MRRQKPSLVVMTGGMVREGLEGAEWLSQKTAKLPPISPIRKKKMNKATTETVRPCRLPDLAVKRGAAHRFERTGVASSSGDERWHRVAKQIPGVRGPKVQGPKGNCSRGATLGPTQIAAAAPRAAHDASPPDEVAAVDVDTSTTAFWNRSRGLEEWTAVPTTEEGPTPSMNEGAALSSPTDTRYAHKYHARTHSSSVTRFCSFRRCDCRHSRIHIWRRRRVCVGGAVICRLIGPAPKGTSSLPH